ncbi:hypothetical protein Pint_12115 [Pistacia integerrima]|uniref:Uncharacterized protein n=1 Tax=Pistacia integerrima TaxID=434235 RepID=A0ACC0XFY8_9ROSI|nr:hypothetical protein Pint_12115 [Pistacia integerrima]
MLLNDYNYCQVNDLHWTSFQVPPILSSSSQEKSLIVHLAKLKEGLGSTLGKLNITAVPTLLFFNNGEKAAEVIGADVARLKDTMEKLYK